MFAMTHVGPDHPLYIEPPKDSMEHVYSGIEFENQILHMCGRSFVTEQKTA